MLIQKDFKRFDDIYIKCYGLRVLLIQKDFKLRNEQNELRMRLRVLLIQKDFKPPTVRDSAGS